MLSQVPVDSREFFNRVLPELFSDPQLLAGRTSRLSVCFCVDEAAHSLRIKDGRLVVNPGRDPEALVSLALAEADFGALFSGVTAELRDQRAGLALQVLLAEEAALVELRELQGGVEFAIKDGGSVRRLLLSLGQAEPDWSQAECVITMELEDFQLVQKGDAHPIELMMQGKLQIAGDPSLLMLLAPLFTSS